MEENEARLSAHNGFRPRQAGGGGGTGGGKPTEPMGTPKKPAPREEEPIPAPKRMPQKKVPCFKPNDLPQAMVPEFDRQIAGQEAGLNDMTVDEYLKGREAFENKDAVRDPKVARDARADYKEKLSEDISRQLQNTGVSAREADKRAAEMAAEKMKTLAALHNPDMVAAGKDVIADFGETRVNSRIGAQWKRALEPKQPTRIDELDKAAKNVPESARAHTKMNAKLERCK